MDYKIFTHEIYSVMLPELITFEAMIPLARILSKDGTYPFVPDVQFTGNSTTKLERLGLYRASGNDRKSNLLTTVVNTHLYLIHSTWR